MARSANGSSNPERPPPKSRCSTASTPSPRSTKRRSPLAGIPFQVRGGGLLLPPGDPPVAGRPAARRRAGCRGELPALVRALLEPLGLTADAPTGVRARERWEALTALAELVDGRSPPARTRPAALVAGCGCAPTPATPDRAGCHLASLHAAKGPGWDAVFLVGLADGTCPSATPWRTAPTVRPSRGAPPALRRNHPRQKASRAPAGRWPASPAAASPASRRAFWAVSPCRPHRPSQDSRQTPATRRHPRCRVCNAVPHQRTFNHVAPL